MFLQIFQIFWMSFSFVLMAGNLQEFEGINSIDILLEAHVSIKVDGQLAKGQVKAEMEESNPFTFSHSNEKLQIRNASTISSLPILTLSVSHHAMQLKVIALDGEFSVSDVKTDSSYFGSRNNGTIHVTGIESDDMTLNMQKGGAKILVENGKINYSFEINMLDTATGKIEFQGTAPKCFAHNDSLIGCIDIKGIQKEKISRSGKEKANFSINDEPSMASPGLAAQQEINGTTLSIKGPTGQIHGDVSVTGMTMEDLGQKKIRKIIVSGVRGKTTVSGNQRVTITTVGIDCSPQH